MIDITKFEGHTAGPWKVKNSWEVFKGGKRLCYVNSGESLCMGDDLLRSAVNARLIAAAPDLLAEVIRLRAEVAALRGCAV